MIKRKKTIANNKTVIEEFLYLHKKIILTK